MSTSRRRFLKSGTLTALTAAFALGGESLAFGQKARREKRGLDLEVPIEAQRQPTFMFTSDTFQPYVGGYFEAPNARGQMVALKLLRVDVYRPSAKTQLLASGTARASDSFSLMFSAPEPLPLFTSIHRMSHGALGKFDLFMTPRAVNGEFFYEAVFNHIR